MTNSTLLEKLFGIFVFCLLGISGPQLIVAQEKASEKSPPTLKLELRVDCKKSRPGTNVIIVARLENTGGKRVIIDKRNLWGFVTFQGFPTESAPYDETDKSFLKRLNLTRYKIAFGDNFEDDRPPKEHSLSLDTREYFEDSLIISLKEEFFAASGRYSIQSTYKQNKDWSSEGISFFIGDIESNELEFRIPTCEKSSR